jgi:hypothetical protein
VSASPSRIAIEASAIIRRWSSHYPADGRFRVFLFDDIASRPAETLQAILGFVGADPSKPGQLPPDHNPKSKARKMQMPGTIRNILIEYLADDVRECVSLLGGAASLAVALPPLEQRRKSAERSQNQVENG